MTGQRQGRPCLVAVAGDPGGAGAVAPVIAMLLREGKARVAPYAYLEACHTWKEQGIPFTPLPDPLSPAMAADILRREGAGALLSGTSAPPHVAEKLLIAAAKSQGIPSLSVLDFWSNYRQRWSNASGELAFLPDRIAVMDVQAQTDMAAEGFDRSRLVVTGQPAYDSLAAMRESFTAGKRTRVRHALGVGDRERLVVFASQPLSLAPPGGEDRGYTERTAIPLVAGALDRISAETGERIVLAIRPHPKEDAGSFAGYTGEKARVIVAARGDPRELVLAADLVLGMTSALLVEACRLGGVVGSIQPGLAGPDLLPTDALGCSLGVYAAEDIKPAIQKLLLDPAVREGLRGRAAPAAPAGATRRVADLVYRMLGIGVLERG